jgi:hypothetical protein
VPFTFCTASLNLSKITGVLDTPVCPLRGDIIDTIGNNDVLPPPLLLQDNNSNET